MVYNSEAIIQGGVKFFYASPWSEPATWNMQKPPANGDALHVMPCQTLLVNESPGGVLKSVLVEGSLIFSDEIDIKFEAEEIQIASGANFIIGEEGFPYKSNINITLHGEGLKGHKYIICEECNFQVHGLEKSPTWTFLKDTVDVQDIEIKLTQEVNW